ncbi:MAG: bifunctional pyr operon transcriptional regulator/uracil phosphoribosyltransferase PyrR [Sulfuricella sp.]|nr:bifunctional pyr operon transcriptional regulator/uracil phosphoribosyltransferase PyrR [Sulfuricella sp.]
MELPKAEQLIAEMARQLRPYLPNKSALVGIHTGGAWVAERLHAQLGMQIPCGTLDISFYRDDFSRTGLHPVVKPSHIPFDVDGSHIILVDDVLYTGRTVRAAMNILFDYGRPASVTLAVMIDRGGKEVPICAKIVGANLTLAPSENIQLTRDERGELSLRLKAVS